MGMAGARRWKIGGKEIQWGKLLAHAVLLLGSIVFVFPFVWLISTSVKPDYELFSFPPTIIPSVFRWDNYTRMLDYLPFFLFLKNTLYVTFMNVAGTLISSSMVAYGFARLRFPGKNVLFGILLSTMMLPPQVTMIPMYLIFRQIGWIDSFPPLYIHAWFGIPFQIFLLRQFMMTIPVELEEAAKIDGCGYARIFSQIMLPLLKPALATVAVFRAMFAWNDFMGPLIYLNSTEKMTMSIGLKLFQSVSSTEWALMMAASTLMVMPIVFLFFFAQRFFIQGITVTGLKG